MKKTKRFYVQSDTANLKYNNRPNLSTIKNVGKSTSMAKNQTISIQNSTATTAQTVTHASIYDIQTQYISRPNRQYHFNSIYSERVEWSARESSHITHS